MRTWRSVVVLSGGVGGARLIDGLAEKLRPEALAVVVNTGDDFVHLGVTVCPDLDTVMYTLAGLADRQRGWGLAGDSHAALSMVERYGGPTWFQLGDRDLGTHLARSQALASGASLSAVTERLCRALGVEQRILPMAEDARPTLIHTAEHGILPFQEWFVRERCRPVPRSVSYGGSGQPAPGVLAAIAGAELIVIAPSNPYVSIEPILTLTGVADAVAQKPVVAVSPIVAGRAVKGPLADMIRKLSAREPSAAAIAAHYAERHGNLLGAIVVERGDEAEIRDLPVPLPVLATDTVMATTGDRVRLAGEVLTFAESLS